MDQHAVKMTASSVDVTHRIGGTGTQLPSMATEIGPMVATASFRSGSGVER